MPPFQLKLLLAAAALIASANAAAMPAVAQDDPMAEGVFAGAFGDDDGSVHEPNIERIAEWGIDPGCADGRFCPSGPLTRAEMAAWLFWTSVHLNGTLPPVYEFRLSDVARDAWYRPYALWAAAAGVMASDGEIFDPDRTVTRADAAEMLVAAFDHLSPATEIRGLFSDALGAPESAVRAMEGIYDAGVTKGCSAEPLRFCPNREVTRAQTASLLARAVVLAQPTVGLILNEPESTAGYTVFMGDPTAYLIDHLGREVYAWDLGDMVLTPVKLLENGNLMGILREQSFLVEVTPTGQIVWEYGHPLSLHHDFVLLPDGNVLVLSRESMTTEEAVAAGADPDYLTMQGMEYDRLLEVRPTGPRSGEIVWEWSPLDHVIQDRDPDKANYGPIAHPGRIDINYNLQQLYMRGEYSEDWLHINSIDYHPVLDQIMLSARNYGELWVIDHATTAAEAAGEKGDLLYRWGNPRAYATGGLEDQHLFWAHHAQWIKPGLPGEGNILIFNNGSEFSGFERYYSSVDEIVPPSFNDGVYQREPVGAFGPAQLMWTYTARNPTDFHAHIVSGTQRLPNGNTLIIDGISGTIFQATFDGEIVWKYISPVLGDSTKIYQGDKVPARPNRTIETPYGLVHTLQNWLYRAEWYPPDYPGLQGLDLTPKGPIEPLR